ncbi:lysozyme [Pseudophaeobacter arcticus]|uniref:lysozyme n=1 Tax=Pseudophaeobacter arcticus TaxID=385492 RepID=UPI003A9876DF
MKLISNWKTVLTRAASVWFVLAGLVALLGFFFATISPEMTRCSPVYFAVASAVFQTLAIPARIVLQAGLADLREFRRSQAGAIRNRSLGIIAGSGIALSTALAFIGGWEGLRQEAYRDVVGVWTVCYGKTQQVDPGDHYSKAECDQILAAEILSYEAALDQCLTATVPLGMKIALVSWTYNVGAKAACQSTLLRLANVGDLEGACNELQRWNRAGGKVWRGLTRRRFSEMEMCHAALEAAR